MPGIEITKNFERHRIVPPSRFIKFKTVDVGHPGGSKIIIGKTRKGQWKTQSIMIGRHENPYMKKKLRGEANKLIGRYFR